MALLETRKLTAFYGDFQALYGIDTTLEAGETIALIGAKPASDIVKLGIALVPEGRRLFPSLTVEENLKIGGHGRKMQGPWTLDRVYALFPFLRERRSSASPTLSGGQQQMAAIGRAL